MELNTQDTKNPESEGYNNSDRAARRHRSSSREHSPAVEKSDVANEQVDEWNEKARAEGDEQHGSKQDQDQHEPAPVTVQADDAIDDNGRDDPSVERVSGDVIDRAIEPVLEGQGERHRTSLDALQAWPQSWAWPAPGLDEASRISLPSLISLSSLSSENSQNRQLPPGRSLDVLMISPQDIPLPQHTHGKLVVNPFMRWAAGGPMPQGKKRDKKSQPPPPPPPFSRPAPELRAYRSTIAQLSLRLKTLRNVSVEQTRHTWGSRIIFYDYLEATRVRHEPWMTHTSAPSYQEFFSKSRTVPDNCKQRLILVEDLNPALIDLLGATFHIPPHVFEEHLDRSGFATVSRQDQKKSSWQTRSPIQGYSSITWYRPVIPLISITPKFRSQLIANQGPLVDCNRKECRDDGHGLSLCTLTNIWRRHLNLSPEPGVHYKDSPSEYPSGWEERATVWSHELNDCRFVVLLLDPLPTVVDHRTPPRSSHAQELVESTNPRNIPDWIPPPPGLAPDTVLPDSSPATRLNVPIINVNAATSNYPRATGAQIQHSDTVSQTASFRQRAVREITERTAKASRNRVHNAPVRPDSSETTSALSALRTTSNWGVDHGKFVPYHAVKTRSSSALKDDIFTAMDMHSYIDSLEIPSSTLDEFEYFMQLQEKGKETTYDPFRALMSAIHDDSLSLIDVIRVSLRRIREGTLDEDLMQKRVTFWRALLQQLNFSLVEFDQRLREFTRFVSSLDMQPPSVGPRAELPSEKFANEIHRTLRSCMDLIDKSSDSLRAEMQIVDSRRSIAEAESISKLTELAFVFIPLSFVASLFSMQIHELDGGVPAYLFALVAMAFVGIAYAVRLSIRNSRIVEIKNRLFTQIRDEAQLQYNEPIPTHTFVRHLGKTIILAIADWPKKVITTFAPIILVLAVVAAILSPIVLLWLRGIDRGFSAVLTVLLLLLDGVLVYPVLTNSAGEIDLDFKAMWQSYKRSRELHQERKLREKRKRARRKQGLDEETQGMEGDDSESEYEDI